MVQDTKKRQRSCIGCGNTAAKGSLHRMVRRPDGAVSCDPSGRMAGRGAYVCSMECFGSVRKARKLERALRTKLTEEDYERIAAELARVCDAETGKTEE